MMTKNEKELRSEELLAQLEKVQFYYHTANGLKNVFTACLLIDKDGSLIARGISICSITDNFRKNEGRSRAYGRALKAWFRQQTDCPIMENRWHVQIINRKGNQLILQTRFKIDQDKLALPLIETKKYFTHKSMFKPKPTLEELQMFECLRGGKDEQRCYNI